MPSLQQALLGADYVEINIAKGVGALAQRLAYSDEELLVSLANSLKLREQEIADRNSLTGRFTALFVGKDGGTTIKFDGMRLKQLHELAASRPPRDINLNAFYEVNLEYSRILLSKAQKAGGRT
ncbi:hypothetical protein [Pelagibius marinus]|uniref:hypothetical protein n=1 Tax=Pelagibius marinus TaxID=2762760 RepID=UPI0018726CFA|nr:hypothetical protein [Pelagibius marinus]